MLKPHSRQPAEIARAKRRSLVELTAAASRTIDEGLLGISPGPVAVVRDDGPQVEQTATPAQTAAPAGGDGSVAIPVSAQAASRSARSQDSNGTTTDFAVEIIRDMQARTLETMRAGVHAALDYARDLASPESDLLQGPAAECHAIVLELMKVNAGATLQYTRSLGRARTLSELIELSSSHARKQCELVLQQAESLKPFAHNTTKPGSGR
ncbi:phasin family protein [Bradyrhizobium sp. PMVTL-01]|uniref:phasin family protein n=1 Tax=Bradyrhizobium sp. PMVTL-01 TaxID=3434999 RepID=UPI003F71BCFB